MTHQEALERWRAEALALPAGDYKLTQPLFVLIGEATDLAVQTRRYWATSHGKGEKKQIVVRGLDLADKSLKNGIADELTSLADALQRSNAAYLFQAGRSSRAALMAEGQELVSELQHVLDWHFRNDGVDDENDVKLANLHVERDADPNIPDALAVELLDYASLSGEVRGDIDGLGGLDVHDIDRASEVAASLREVPADAGASPDRAAVSEALGLRNRIGFLLTSRMNQVRSAATFVFRDQPEIVKLFTSTYERKKRGAHRPAKKKAAGAREQPGGQGGQGGGGDGGGGGGGR